MRTARLQYANGFATETSNTECVKDERMSKEKGFTLIELMTTLGIVTILAAVAIPNLQSFTMNSRQTGGINDIVMGMRAARNLAITTNSRVTMCASESGTNCDGANWNQGWIVFADLDADQSVDPGETIARSGGSNETLDISSGQFGRFLVYRPNGRVMNANVAQNSGSFSICDDRGTAYAKSIMLDLSGRPRAIDKYSGIPMPVSC